MGQAKQRGSFEDRKSAAIQKAANDLAARKAEESRRRVGRRNAVVGLGDMLGVVLSAGLAIDLEKHRR